MNIENQVCTLEQAKKLKACGINTDMPHFSWYENCRSEWVNGVRVQTSGVGETMQTKANAAEFGDSDSIFPAFTVAELGVMLPDDGEGCGDWYTNRDAGCYKGNDIDGFSCWHFMDSKSPITIEGSKVFPTEAEARAALLIYMLKKNILTPEEANQRLSQS